MASKAAVLSGSRSRSADSCSSSTGSAEHYVLPQLLRIALAHCSILPPSALSVGAAFPSAVNATPLLSRYARQYLEDSPSNCPAAVVMFSTWLAVYTQLRRTHKEVVWRLR